MNLLGQQGFDLIDGTELREMYEYSRRQEPFRERDPLYDEAGHRAFVEAGADRARRRYSGRREDRSRSRDRRRVTVDGEDDGRGRRDTWHFPWRTSWDE